MSGRWLSLPALSIVAAALPLCSPARGQAEAVPSPDPVYMTETEVPRFAIVISTSSYDDPQLETASVANAERDADRISKVLLAARFDPVVLRNPTGHEIRKAVSSLVDRQIRFENEKGFRPVLAVYFAGHGFSADGQDFITGRDFRKDANIQSGVAISDIIRLVSSSSDLLVFNDACRTRLAPSPMVMGESIDAAGEAAPEERLTMPIRPDEPRGFASDEIRSLLSFAAQHGRIAKGFVGALDYSSPYSGALADQLLQRDVPLRDLLNRVRWLVVERTARTQYPQVEDGGAASGSFHLVRSPAQDQLDRAAWEQALKSGDRMTIVFFVQERASSRYAAAARRWLSDHAPPP